MWLNEYILCKSHKKLSHLTNTYAKYLFMLLRIIGNYHGYYNGNLNISSLFILFMTIVKLNLKENTRIRVSVTFLKTATHICMHNAYLTHRSHHGNHECKCILLAHCDGYMCHRFGMALVCKGLHVK